MSRTVIVAAVASLVLAGCTGTTEPAQPPTSEDALTTTSPSTEEATVTSEAAPTTEEPEETEADGPPQMPEEAMEQTEAGAEAFVEHYLEQLNEARRSGDTDEVASLASPDCESCRNFEESAQDGGLAALVFEVGQSVLTGDQALVTATVVDGPTEGQAYFDLAWDSASWQVLAVKAGA